MEAPDSPKHDSAPVDSRSSSGDAAVTAPAATAAIAKKDTDPAPAAAGDPGKMRPAMLEDLEAMKARIAQLEAELSAADGSAALEGAKKALEPNAAAPAAAMQDAAAGTAPGLDSEVTTKSAPFAYADWTWLNGNPRTNRRRVSEQPGTLPRADSTD